MDYLQSNLRSVTSRPQSKHDEERARQEQPSKALFYIRPQTRHRPTRDVFPLGRARAGKLRAQFSEAVRTSQCASPTNCRESSSDPSRADNSKCQEKRAYSFPRGLFNGKKSTLVSPLCQELFLTAHERLCIYFTQIKACARDGQCVCARLSRNPARRCEKR